MFRNNRRFPNRPLAADQIALLAKANELMLEGKPSEAGPLFVQLAKNMQSSNHPQQGKHPRRGLLPTSCPKCGAPVHSEDIDWVDENTAECEYCGTLIRTEE
jgi:hypothetical protein